MRILVWGDATCHTGFAQVTHNVFERLVRDFGHDVAVLGVNSRGDYWDTPLRIYRANLLDPYDLYGGSRIVELLGKEMPDAVVMVNDPAVILNLLVNNKHDPELALWRGITNGTESYKPPILAYLTSDGYDAPRSTDVLASRVTRIAMSHFGQVAMPEAPVIWHGVDPAVFRPVDRHEAKVRLGYDPDDFLILNAEKNSLRKDQAAVYKAVRPVMRRYPNARLHLHCSAKTGDGYDIPAIMWNDEDVRDRVNFSPGIGGYTAWPEENLALLMAAADLYVSASHGEGFGLNLIQSLACGTPVVATNCSAISEVVGPGGILIPPAGRISTPMGQDQCLPDIPAFSEAIERLYNGRGSRRKLADAGIEHSRKFSWDVAAQKFDALLRERVAIESPPIAVGV